MVQDQCLALYVTIIQHLNSANYKQGRYGLGKGSKSLNFYAWIKHNEGYDEATVFSISLKKAYLLEYLLHTTQ